MRPGKKSIYSGLIFAMQHEPPQAFKSELEPRRARFEIRRKILRKLSPRLQAFYLALNDNILGES
jgi:hypothetical protein